MENCMIDPPDTDTFEDIERRHFDEGDYPDPENCFLCGDLCFGALCPRCLEAGV